MRTKQQNNSILTPHPPIPLTQRKKDESSWVYVYLSHWFVCIFYSSHMVAIIFFVSTNTPSTKHTIASDRKNNELVFPYHACYSILQTYSLLCFFGDEINC
jgi:hypothetical protein